MRTGIFGGTFDPVHIGHLILAETVRNAENLDRIVFLPANQPPHKLEQTLASPDHRLNMLRLSVGHYPELQVSDFEIRKGGVSYTIDTLEALQMSLKFKNDHLYPIIGEDSLAELQSWKDPDQIVGRFQLLCFRRSGVHTEHINQDVLSRIKMIDAPLISVSSSEIRRRVNAGKSIRFWVPEKVESYIRKHGLYR